MLEYRKRNEKGLAQTPQAGPANPGTGDTEKYMTIAAKYWIDDMDIGVSGGIEQTVEQEYQAYITAPLSPRNVIILNFWEVGDFVNDISVVLMGHRHHIAG
jgi:hypothetical protein